jgi:hypothetical protein
MLTEPFRFQIPGGFPALIVHHFLLVLFYFTLETVVGILEFWIAATKLFPSIADRIAIQCVEQGQQYIARCPAQSFFRH